LLDQSRSDGLIADWFFIRYWEGGPHLRIRLRDPLPGVADRLRAELTRLMAEAPYEAVDLDGDRYYARLGGQAADSLAGWHEHGEVCEIAYVAETGRYGGPDAMPVAEDVFCRSSQVAVHVIAATPEPRTRLALAAELTIATAVALGLDRLGAARWLRRHAGNWRWQTEVGMFPPAIAQAQTARVLLTQAAALHRRWSRVEALASAEDGVSRSPVAAWAGVVREGRRRLEAAGVDAGVTSRWVWGSQLHMMFNRLGITPDEERSVCWLVASSALSPDGVTPFFDDGDTAADRRYQEASKFLPGLRQIQGPRDIPDAPRTSPAAYRRAIELPADEAPAMPLAVALRRRVSGRGKLTGPVSATDLGTLIWHGHGITHRSLVTLPDGTEYDYAHRPYPSAGSKYVARLRLIVRDVAGLEPGTYHVDEVERAVYRLGPAPSLSDLAATSMWFGPEALPIGGIELAELPAMLALHVELAGLRRRYGLRALRFATAEAGHLAQTLSLVAAATGLSLGLIGGFYDDVAHEVLGLDGVDDVLVYLLPVGRPGPRP